MGDQCICVYVLDLGLSGGWEAIPTPKVRRLIVRPTISIHGTLIGSSSTWRCYPSAMAETETPSLEQALSGDVEMTGNGDGGAPAAEAETPATEPEPEVHQHISFLE
jgi:hypothetical protein